MNKLEEHFESFAKGIIAAEEIRTPYGIKPMVYADWTASGRPHQAVEDVVANGVLPLYGNTHTDTCETGERTTAIHQESKNIIREHVNAGPDDVVITIGSGMTGAVNRLQRILGLRSDSKPEDCVLGKRPVVFVTHMEHHSNQTSWEECDVDVVIIPPNKDGLPDLEFLKRECAQYKAKDRSLIGAFTACSNVTGIRTPLKHMAQIMHEHGGLAFGDFAANAPYDDIDMHPNEHQYLDALYFSPHKLMGGIGTSGVLVANKSLYKRKVPVNVGGGIVHWTNPFGGHRFIDGDCVKNIEALEEAGTPAIIQDIRIGLAIRLKEAMNPNLIWEREHQLITKAFAELSQIPGLHILEPAPANRIGIISFHVENLHYNLVVKLLNDHFGIQMRGGCACAGTYGHILFNIDAEESQRITCQIDQGNLKEKPGFIRLSLHPTMSDETLSYILGAIRTVVTQGEEIKKDYEFVNSTGSWRYIGQNEVPHFDPKSVFDMVSTSQKSG